MAVQLAADRLITLGSPHQAVRATLRMMVDRLFPGCHEPGWTTSPLREKSIWKVRTPRHSRRSASGSYKSIAGDAELSGDGLVPVGSALLEGSRHLVQADTAHGGFFGKLWYGSAQRLESWWPFVIGDQA